MTLCVDVLVVGGGIHGTGVAQAAAAAGHSVLLLERTALAEGSSSRSSKLIHGGLRYLESWQLHLVRESLHERSVLLRIAPELVKLQRFHIPIYGDTRRRPWQLRVGLSMYAALAGFGVGAGFGTVARREWDLLDGLETRGLERVFWYQDGQTDDRALTGAVMRSAQSLGAQLELPARFVGAELTGDRVRARWIGALGSAHGEAPVERECEARVLVNAAGPWAAEVAGSITPGVFVPTLELVQGTHLLLDQPPARGVYYLENPRDGRAIFLMPWHGKLLLGTTEVRFRGDPATVHPSQHEINYLLQVLRHYFPRWRNVRRHDLAGSFAGLRVLPAGEGHAFHRSRETLLCTDRESSPRLLSIYGGKLTGWRAVAARVMERIAPALPARRARALTDQMPLTPA